MFGPRGPTLGELARQALSSTRHGYDLLAPKFDATPFRTPDWLLDAVAPRLGAPHSVARAVDLCCGTGAGLRILRPLCRELLVGVDFSLGMLAGARASARAGTFDASRAGTPRCADAARSAFDPGARSADAARSAFDPGARSEDGSRLVLVQQDVLQSGLRERFDLAATFGALGHLRPADQRRFLAGARACLRPGGRLAFVTAPVPPPWSLALWVSAAFDGAMWVRNRLWRPPFFMYYLAWPLGRSLRLLRAAGFAPEATPLVVAGRPTRLRLVLATRE
jgi:SAM-dependent methyltransferase